jgi:hypothetical protein
MALSRTAHGPYVHATAGFVAQGTGPYTSSSFASTSGSLLVVVVMAGTDNPGSGEPSYVLTGGGLTWTKRVASVVSYGGDGMMVQIWTAPVTTGASITLTVTHTGINSYNMGIYPFTYTGHDTTTPTGGKASGSGNSGTNTLTLDATPASDSEVIAAIVVAANDGDAAGATIAPGSSFTELAEQTNTDSFAKRQTQARTGSTSTGVSWTTTTDAGGGYDQRVYAALEIKALSAGGGSSARNFGFIIG